MFVEKFYPTVYISCIYLLWPAKVSGALSVAVCTQDLLKKVPIFFITSTIVWSQVKQQGENTALPSNRDLDCPVIQNWSKDLPSMAPPIRTRPSFPHSQSFPTGSFHKPLIILQKKADRMKTAITEEN